MELTRIGDQNWESFSPIIYDAYTKNAPEVLRIGAIEDGKACAAMSLSFDMKNDHAFIDALYVVPEYRGQGKGKELVEEAVRLTGDKVSCLEAEFYGGSEGFEDFFTKAGFACIPGEPIYAYDVKKLLSNKQYADYCKHTLSGVRTMTFLEMSDAQRRSVFNLLQKSGERNTLYNTAGFTPELSVTVYREEDTRVPRATLIATMCEGRVNIAQLYGSGKNNPKFILATIFGFTDGMKKKYGNSRVATLSMVAAHPGVKRTFELLFGKKLKPNESELVHAIRFMGV